MESRCTSGCSGRAASRCTTLLRITHEIAEALGHAHPRGVLHRDVKPENILLAGYSHGRRCGTNWHAVVADFGLARAIGAAEYQRLTETGIIVGTVFYMSPEQLKEDRNLDQRADIYSLGCILYEMLTSAPPYTGSSISDIVRRILRGSTPSAARTNPQVPREIESSPQPRARQVAGRAVPVDA